MSHTETHHQGVMEMFWLHFQGAFMLSIFLNTFYVPDPLPPQQRHQLMQVIWPDLVARDVLYGLNTVQPDLFWIDSEIMHMICHNRTGPVLNPDESWSYNAKSEPVRIPDWASALLNLMNPLRTLLCIIYCWISMPLPSEHVLWTELSYERV